MQNFECMNKQAIWAMYILLRVFICYTSTSKIANRSLLPPSFCRLQTCGLANDSLDTFWNSTLHSGIENRSWILAVCLFTLCSQYLQYDDKLLWNNFAFSYHSSMQPQGIRLRRKWVLCILHWHLPALDKLQHSQCHCSS